MKKVLSLAILLILMVGAIFPEWSLIEIGKKLGENTEIATLIITSLLIVIIILAVAFLYFNPPSLKRRKNDNE